MTAVGGAAVGGFFYPTLGVIIEAFVSGRFELLMGILHAIVIGILFGIFAIVGALPYTALGTIILFYPSCKLFGKRTVVDLVCIMTMGAIMGGILIKLENIIHILPNVTEIPDDLSIWTGSLFGVITGYFGWSLMEAKETERYDG